MNYLNAVEPAPGWRVVMWQSGPSYIVEHQQHISLTNGSLPWEFDRDGWRTCSLTGHSSAFDAVVMFNCLADGIREQAHGRF